MTRSILLASLLLAGCASRLLVMPIDNFGIVEVGGVEIEYPTGGGTGHVENGVFRYELANAKIVVQHRRFYVNAKFGRALRRGDKLKLPGDNTVSLNGRQIFP